MYDEKADFEHHDAEMEHMFSVLGALDLAPAENGLYLDVGGGQGMHVWKLLPRCSQLFVTDILNYSNLYDGHFLHLLLEKHERHGRPFNLSKVSFVTSDAQSQLFRDGFFDFVFSFNAMEHVPNPGAALNEIVRLLKPGGTFFVQFDPIWTSPAGNHFSHFVPEPWAHLLLSEAEFITRMREAGAGEAETREYISAMNRYSCRAFFDLIEELSRDDRITMRLIEHWAEDRSGEPGSEHPNFARLLDLGYSERDLVVRGFRLCGTRVGTS